MINSGGMVEGLVYNQFAGVCLPSDISYKTYGVFVVLIVFDIFIMSLTTFKTYWHVRREPSALVVCVVHYQPTYFQVLRFYLKLYTLFRDGVL